MRFCENRPLKLVEEIFTEQSGHLILSSEKLLLNVREFLLRLFCAVLQAIAVVLDEFPMITLPYAEHYFGQDVEKVG